MFHISNTITVIACCICLLVGIILFQINLKIVPNDQVLIEKSSPYECGFDPFTSVREKTSVHFYLYFNIIFNICILK